MVQHIHRFLVHPSYACMLNIWTWPWKYLIIRSWRIVLFSMENHWWVPLCNCTYGWSTISIYGTDRFLEHPGYARMSNIWPWPWKYIISRSWRLVLFSWTIEFWNFLVTHTCQLFDLDLENSLFQGHEDLYYFHGKSLTSTTSWTP